jgi:hypothetical protein
MEVQRIPTPPIVESTFLGSDRVTQAILGNYDSVLATNEQNVSGIAISNGSLHSGSAASPYLEGYIKGINRVCQIILDLIPKYYVTPRTIPIKKPDGKKSYQLINDKKNEKSIEINYRSHELQIKVESGVNSSIQKQIALEHIIKMMQVSPLFAQFINSQGLEVILDNLDIRGIESMKSKASEFMQMVQKQQEEEAQKPDPTTQIAQMAMEIEAMKVEQKQHQAEMENAIMTAKVAIEKQKVDAQVMQITNEIETENAKLGLEAEKVDSENARSAVEAAIELSRLNVKDKEGG